MMAHVSAPAATALPMATGTTGNPRSSSSAMEPAKTSAAPPQFEARSLEASVAPGARGVAFADRRAVEQILTNLLDNACKYTEPGGRIEVRVSEDGGQVRLEVEDTGVGIPPEDLPRIFERFYRVDKARSRDLGGTGLGLAIVKHLAQAQGGEVSVRSKPHEGTTFTVVLPRAG